MRIQKECAMKINYKKLWIRLIEKEISPATLRKDLSIATGTMTKLRKNEEVALSVLLRICGYLDCNIGDICDAIKIDSEQLWVVLYFSISKGVAKSQGKIQAGYYKDLIGQDNKTVIAHFEAAGFENIEVIDLNDSGIAFWTDGEVVTISVGGDTNFDTFDWFEPDTKVIISHH